MVRAELAMAQRSHRAECEHSYAKVRRICKSQRLAVLEAEESAEEARRQAQLRYARVKLTRLQKLLWRGTSLMYSSVRLLRMLRTPSAQLMALRAAACGIYSRAVGAARCFGQCYAGPGRDIRRDAAKKEAELQKRLNALDTQIRLNVAYPHRSYCRC